MTKPALRLETEIQYLKGVGPKLGVLLGRKGISTVNDLLHYYPRAYEDRRAARNIGTLKSDDIVSLKAVIVKVASFRLGRSSRKIYDILIRDSSGQIHCKFFRVPYKGYFERFSPNKEVRIIGKVLNYRGRLEFHHPEIKDLEGEEELQDALVPIYPEIENLSTTKIAKLIRSSLDQLETSSWPQEKFPSQVLAQNNLITKKEALIQIHMPNPSHAENFHKMKSQAHRRLIFEEFFWLELYLAAKKTGLKKEKGIRIRSEKQNISKLTQSLPFQMTGAQKRAIEQIVKDMEGSHPMNRLIQGDVGCGKTLVALSAAAQVAEGGYQTCLMAPTEILAEQHFKNSKKILEPLGIQVGILTGKTKSAERKKILEALQAQEISLLIGTHALIEDPVQFKNLALVVIDEQHRFGVQQRALLKDKGMCPHFLVMTATPIPRTLAMTVYGDLDVTVIDEMPPGRSPIQTRVVYENKRNEAMKFLAEQVQKGRQSYVVYPLVEESEKIDLKNAIDEFEKLKHEFPQIHFGLLHGRMKPEEKDAVMVEFRENKIQVLISTTVIEVGVDVPNANLMIIEHAERFGLSQLHQLRGRVGRGSQKSFCVMILGRAVSQEARERTQFMESTTDGFKIAEFDLELRGPGEFLGTRQSGLPGFRLANLVRDIKILQEAREAAFQVLQRDPLLQDKDNINLRVELLHNHGPTALAGIA